MSMNSKSAAAILRQRLTKDDIIVCPGVYDGLTARIALQVGFDALYMTGAGTSMSATGMADLGLITMTEMKQNVEMIANLDPSVPLIADADTGYGSPINVARTVQQYIRTGVAAFHLEDQVVNKKCGHLAGKQCVSRAEYLSRIKAAVVTREKLGSDVLIIARTDALQQYGLEEAIGRLQDAVALGADIAMLEAMTTREQCEAFVAAFQGSNVPLLYGMVQGTKSFQMTPSDAQAMGFKIIVYAAACLAPMFLSVTKALEALRIGQAEEYPGVSPHDIFNACGMKELLAFDEETLVNG